VECLELGKEPVGFADVEDVVELGQPIEQRLPVLDGHAAGERDRPTRTRTLPGNQLTKLPKTFCSALARTVQ